MSDSVFALFENKTHRYLTTKEVAEYLRISEKTVWNLVYQGKLKPRKPFGKLLFCKHELDLLIERGL